MRMGFFSMFFEFELFWKYPTLLAIWGGFKNGRCLFGEVFDHLVKSSSFLVLRKTAINL